MSSRITRRERSKNSRYALNFLHAHTISRQRADHELSYRKRSRKRRLHFKSTLLLSRRNRRSTRLLILSSVNPFHFQSQTFSLILALAEQQKSDLEAEKAKLEDARTHVSNLKKELVRMSDEVTAMQVRPSPLPTAIKSC
jgi:hypothetical protein